LLLSTLLTVKENSTLVYFYSFLFLIRFSTCFLINLQQCRSAYGLGWGYYTEGDLSEALGVGDADVLDPYSTQTAPLLLCSVSEVCDGSAVSSSSSTPMECGSDVDIVSTAGSDSTDADAVIQSECTAESTDSVSGDDVKVSQSDGNKEIIGEEVGRDVMRIDNCEEEIDKDGDVIDVVESNSNGVDGWCGGPVGVCLDLSYDDVMTHRLLSGKDRGKWRVEKKVDVQDTKTSQTTGRSMLQDEDSRMELGPSSGPGSMPTAGLSPAIIPSVPHLSCFPSMSQYLTDLKSNKALKQKIRRTNQKKTKTSSSSDTTDWGLKSNGERLAIASDHDPWLSLCATDLHDIRQGNALEKTVEDSIVSPDSSANNSWRWDFMSNVVDDNTYHTKPHEVCRINLLHCLLGR
jgi:hypothetical protein